MEEKMSCCLAKVLKVIEVLQCNVEKFDDCDESCTRPFLGGSPNIVCYNTRPVSFYTCQNNLVTIDYQLTENGETTMQTSSVFRVEEVKDCCVTVSILRANPTPGDPARPYITTGQTATINLKCICALRCLADIVIDCL